MRIKEERLGILQQTVQAKLKKEKEQEAERKKLEDEELKKTMEEECTWATTEKIRIEKEKMKEDKKQKGFNANKIGYSGEKQKTENSFFDHKTVQKT